MSRLRNCWLFWTNLPIKLFDIPFIDPSKKEPALDTSNLCIKIFFNAMGAHMVRSTTQILLIRSVEGIPWQKGQSPLSVNLFKDKPEKKLCPYMVD